MSKLLQLLGAVIFGLTLWKGVHGFWVTTGLIGGALLAYVAKHYDLAAAYAALKAHGVHLGILFLAVGLYACGAQKIHAQKPRVVLPRECIDSVQLTDKTECSGPDGGALRCGPLLLQTKCGPVLAFKGR